VALTDNGHLVLEILQRFQHRGMEARLVPFALVERRVFIGVGADLLQPFENGLLALAGIHGLALAEPVTLARLREIAVVIGRGKGPAFHRRSSSNGSRPYRSVRARRVRPRPRRPAAAGRAPRQVRSWHPKTPLPA